MAYYLIKYNEKYYANEELFREHKSCTARDLLVKEVSGEVRAVILTDYKIYEISSPEEVSGFGCAVNFQDIDEATKNLKKAPKSKSRASVTTSECPVFLVKGIPFVRLRDVAIPKKYSRGYKFPHIKICGTIFLAEDSVVKGFERDSVVFKS